MTIILLYRNNQLIVDELNYYMNRLNVTEGTFNIYRLLKDDH